MTPYGTVELASAYHAAVGNTAWDEAASSPDTARESALLRASMWVDATYRARFSGTRAEGRAQPREWPRINAVDASGEELPDDEVPDEVLRATYEAALRELVTPGSLTPDVVVADRITSERVGPISVTYSDRVMSIEDQRPVVTLVDDILMGLLAPMRSPFALPTGRAY